MREHKFTIIDDGSPVDVPASIADGAVRLSPDAVKTALGWELKPGGLCRREGIDLAALAALLRRPIALDPSERAAYLGAPAREWSEALASLEAPDFTLPDLDGRPHSLTDYRGQKVLLIAYASWWSPQPRSPQAM